MRFKQIVKKTAITAGRLMPRATRGRRVVLCYHSVHPRRPFHSTPPAVFEQHLAWLTEHCRVTSLNDIMTGPAPDIDDRKPRVAITFDDGYEDNHSYALPLLLKWHAPATFFVTTGFVERDPAVLGRFAALLQCGSSDIVPLEWTQVRELHRAGMDVGSHTHSHPNLAGLSRAQTEDELRTSSIILGDQLGCAVTAFAYPFGKPRVHFTAMTCDVVRATGYRIGAAVTFRALRPSDSTFRVPRFFTDGDSIEKLSAKVRGDYELVGRWQEYAPLPVLRMVSPLDFQR
jgi:peptidoglycan/xylan/chitin deacetylase (PgdA/CDA1 family)